MGDAATGLTAGFGSFMIGPICWIMEFYERVGKPEEDGRLLWEASPLFHVANIKAPLLVGQGKNDPRVNSKESDQMVAAVRDKGIAVEYIVKNNEVFFLCR